MYEIRFSRAPKARSRRWDNAVTPANILRQFKSFSDEFSGWAYVVESATGKKVYRQFISA